MKFSRITHRRQASSFTLHRSPFQRWLDRLNACLYWTLVLSLAAALAATLIQYCSGGL